MIRFIMFSPKIRFDFYNYTNHISSQLQDKIPDLKECAFYINKDHTRRLSVEWGESVYKILFTQRLGKHQQLIVEIKPETINKEEFDEKLHDLKIGLKDVLRNDWAECLWIYDAQSEHLANILYNDVHSLENRLRLFINKVMCYKVGVDWWEHFAPYRLKQKYMERNKEYKEKVPSFKNITTNLLSIDTGDLIKIIEYKHYEWNPTQNREITELLTITLDPDESLSDDERRRIVNLLKDQLEMKFTLWDRVFSKYISVSKNEFIGRWNTFSNYRNHIAHNKLLDKHIFYKFKRNISDISKILQSADENFEKELDRDDAQEIVLRALREEEIEDRLKLYEIKQMEDQANVRIRDKERITEQFKNVMMEFLDEMENEMEYRQDVEFLKLATHWSEGEWHTLFQMESELHNSKLEIKYKLSLNDEPGLESYCIVEVWLNDKLASKSLITYTNGEAYWDEELSCYMPHVKDSLDLTQWEDISKDIRRLIDEHFPNLVQKAEDLKYIAIKDGGRYPVAVFACETCGEEYVSIDEDLFEVGYCVNCGAYHELNPCLRCNDLFPIPDESFCDNCQAFIDGQ